ncbi:MAG TPA: Gfo/Idh/MocA family oxidoreductase [Candidatus Limnocylindrales bacterium]|nr:Gfo/Idh/MocA family oxidoreductase [Candidatus Limnocylindrales bacterium]
MRLAVVALLPLLAAAQPKPLRLAIAGLNHGHVTGFLTAAAQRHDVELAGVWDPQPELRAKYAARYHLAPDLFYADLGKMLDEVKPEAVATFTDTAAHAEVVEAAARRHITVMMEKRGAGAGNEARVRAIWRSGNRQL